MLSSKKVLTQSDTEIPSVIVSVAYAMPGFSEVTLEVIKVAREPSNIPKRIMEDTGHMDKEESEKILRQYQKVDQTAKLKIKSWDELSPKNAFMMITLSCQEEKT